MVYLVRRDGRVLVRRPFVEENVGRDMAQGQIFTQLKQAPAGTFEGVSSTDGVRRFTSYEQGHTYPLVVAVGQAKTELLAPWKQARHDRRLSEIAVICHFYHLMGAFVWRATRTLATNTVKLRETNDRFDAALANMSNGLSMFDADGKLMIWNQKISSNFTECRLKSSGRVPASTRSSSIASRSASPGPRR